MTAHWLGSGMTTSRGARVWCTIARATSLYAVGTETQTMMQLSRIGSKLRGGGPILTNGMQAMESAGAPPPRTVIGDLSQTVPTGSETFRPS